MEGDLIAGCSVVARFACRSISLLSILALVTGAWSRQLRAEDCPLRPGGPELQGHGPSAPEPVWLGGRRADYAVSVSDAGPDQQQQNTSGHTVVFTVSNAGVCDDSYGITVAKSGAVTAATPDLSSVFVPAGTEATVTVTYSVGTALSGTIKLTATGSFAVTDDGTLTVTIVPPPGAPLVDITQYNFETQQYGRCAASCFAAVHAQSTVPYFSLDAPRSVTLVYNGDRVNPKPFVHVNISPDLGYGQTPSQYRLQVKVNGALVTFVNNENALAFAYAGSAPIRIGGHFDASTYATGIYKLEILVAAKYGTNTFIVNSIQTNLLIVNETTSPIARGWTVAGVQRLYATGDSALITEGDGSAVYFRRDNAAYVTPAGEFSRLVPFMPGGGSGWTRWYPDSTRVVFNSTGRMTEVRDRFNNTTTVTYDGSNRVSQVKDPLNLAITLTYDANGLDSIADPMGRGTQVTVDASKRLTLIRDPDLVSTGFGYDGSLRLSTITDRRGNTTTLGYDTQSGKVVTMTPPAVEVVNTDGSLTTASPVTTFEPWQKKGVPYGSTGTPVAAPRADTIYARITDPGGHTSRFTVNRWGSPVVATDPLGRTDSTTVEANGLPVRVRHATGAVDTAAYNADGLPTYQKPSGLPPTQIRYAAWAQPDSVTRGDSIGIRSFIGANGRVDSARVAGGTPDSAKAWYRYDTRGRPDSVLDAMKHLVQLTRYTGTNGNRSRDSTPAGNLVTYGYDAYGRTTTVSRAGFPTVTTFYSVINRPDSVRDGVNPVATRYGYDNLFLTSVTDPKGQVFGFSYNQVGWLAARTDPTGKADTSKYSRDGELRRWKNRRGDVVTSTYDVLHRRTNKAGTNTTSETWAYPNDTVVVTKSPVAQDTVRDTVIVNRHGQVVRASTVLGSQVFSRRYVYSVDGAIDSVIPAGGGLTFQSRKYTWSRRRGTLTGVALGTDTTRIANNADGLPETVAFPGGDTVNVGYTAAHFDGGITTDASYGPAMTRYLNFGAPGGKLSEQVLASGTAGRQYTYDGLGRLKGDTAITWQGPPPPCAGQRYPELNDNGSVCIADESGGGTWIKGVGVAFSYDSAGNRRDKGGTYTSGNRIQTFDSCTYLTDDDGNVTQRTCGSDVATFTWSAESRLIGITTGGQTLAFRYDAQGQLVRKDIGGNPQAYFVWDNGQLLAELDGSGATKRAEYSYYPGQDSLHAIVAGTAKHYAHPDGMLNTIGLTDDQVGVSRTYDYDAWGQLIGGSDNANLNGVDRARFKGALWLGPEVDVYFMRARWYEPKTGRFLSEDPIGIKGGLNQYTFAGDDPVNGRDPSGLLSCGEGVVILVTDGTGEPEAIGCTEAVIDVLETWFQDNHGMSLDEAWAGTFGRCSFARGAVMKCAPGSAFIAFPAIALNIFKKCEPSYTGISDGFVLITERRGPVITRASGFKVTVEYDFTRVPNPDFGLLFAKYKGDVTVWDDDGEFNIPRSAASATAECSTGAGVVSIR
jgi:RHS repeat-associated protein